MFENGEKALQDRVVPATALRRRAAADSSLFQQLPVGRCPVLAHQIGMDLLVGFDQAVPQGPIKSLHHQIGLHRGSDQSWPGA